jgi:1-acyl-sn-glycerol-3-phosphate acyltransferase
MRGIEKVPEERVIFAMNHTDRYNYFPFQYRWWKLQNRFTATWVKGKYYEHRFMAKFMEWTNNLPTVSRGYIISRDFLAVHGARPSGEEYRALRNLVNAIAQGSEAVVPDLSAPELFTKARSVLGRPFDPSVESYGEAMNRTFEEMMGEFTRLNELAFETGLDLLAFPQGTRSVRLSRGRPGIAHMAFHTKRPIVPVGCSGSDLVYPGGSPFGRKGHIIYQFGDPIPYSEYGPIGPELPFTPFSSESELVHGASFQKLSDLIMDRINELVEPPYRFDLDQQSEGVQGASRFV